MKINKYINAFIATALMAVGVASCTNDDTVDSKNLYVINLQTTGLDEAQQSEFDKVVKSKTFGVDVTEAHQQVYGLYSSEAYAKARYQEILSSSMVLDSIVNVYADQSNNVDFSVNVVLMKDSTAVLQTSQAIKPTVQRENYTISINQDKGSLDDAGVQTLSDLTKQIMGVDPNSSASQALTPGYAKTHYLSVLPAELAAAITALVPEKGAPVIFEDFSETISLSKDGAEVGVVTVAPYCDYVAWFDITAGSLSEFAVEELYGQVKQDIFDGMDAYPWDKRQKIDRSKAIVNYTNLMITNNNAIQKIVDNYAAMMDITDFSVNFHLSVADGVTAPVGHAWKTFTEQDKIFKANIVKDDYKIKYEVSYGSLSETNKEKVHSALAALEIPTLNNIYEATALKQFADFLASTSENGVVVKDIAQYLAKETKTLDFIITFKLFDSKDNVVDKIILKANEGWKTGE